MKMMMVASQVNGMPARFVFCDESGQLWECNSELITDKRTNQTVDCEKVTAQHAYHVLINGEHSDLVDLKAFIQCLLDRDPQSMKL